MNKLFPSVISNGVPGIPVPPRKVSEMQESLKNAEKKECISQDNGFITVGIFTFKPLLLAIALLFHLLYTRAH